MGLDRTTMSPWLSVVVTIDSEDAMMLPPGATDIRETGEAVVTTLPSESVLVMATAGAMLEVVMVEPREFVVVTATMTLVGASPVSKAFVVCTTVLPLLVEVIWTGTRMPVCVLCTSDTVGAVIGELASSVEDTGTSVVVSWPWLFVVVT